MRSRCGLVEIDPTNDHAVLQAQASRQVYSRNIRAVSYTHLDVYKRQAYSNIPRAKYELYNVTG